MKGCGGFKEGEGGAEGTSADVVVDSLWRAMEEAYPELGPD